MNRIITIFTSIMLFSIFIGCAKNPAPQFRIRNDQAVKVNVKVQTSTNEKIAINDIGYQQTTPYQDVAEGNLTVTSVTQNESFSFLAEKNTKYTVIISEGKPPMMVVDK